MKREIKFICHGQIWRDKVNGNTYHSVRITRTSDGKTLACPFQYGYGDHYRQTALHKLVEKNWINCSIEDSYRYERNNNYPIYWSLSEGTKKECIRNGEDTNE